MNLKLEPKKTLFATALMLISVGALGLSFAVNKTMAVHMGGNIYTWGIEIYWDALKTNPVTNVTWPTLHPGGNATTTIFIYNPGTTNLTMIWTMNNWNPSHAPHYFTFTWNPDMNSSRLESHRTMQVDWTLKVDASIANSNPLIENYSFDTTVTSTEA